MAKAKQQVKGSKPSYMTTYEAADFLGFTAGTLRTWRCQGKGPNYYKVGSTVRYEMDDLVAWKNENVKQGYRQESVSVLGV